MKGGFNTNVEHKGVIFHVQTQDKGPESGYIECLIYTSGQVLASRRIPYSSIFENGNQEDFQKIIEKQHQNIIQEIKEGKFDHYLSFEEETQLLEKRKTTVPEKLEIEFLEFKPPTPSSPYFNFSLETRQPDLKKPVPYVDMKVDVITEFGRNFHIFQGKTDDEGKISMKLLIPEFKEKKFMLIFKASKEGFIPTEIKKFFRKLSD
jgi:hypothetical protein